MIVEPNTTTGDIGTDCKIKNKHSLRWETQALTANATLEVLFRTPINRPWCVKIGEIPL